MPGNQLFVANRDLTLHRRPARMGVSFQLQKLTELSEHHLQVFAALGVSAHPVLGAPGEADRLHPPNA